jgi:hypothetical protein
MSSAEPAPDTTTVEVKAEENAGGEANATVTVATEPGPTYLSKQELEQLEGILKRLADYRDEEYVYYRLI